MPFVAKYFPPDMESEWVQKMKPFFVELSEAYIASIETEEIDTKDRLLTSFNDVSMAMFDACHKNYTYLTTVVKILSHILLKFLLTRVKMSFGIEILIF